MSPARSRKRSGISSRPGALPNLPPIYVDESLSQQYLPTALRDRDLRVIIRAEKFPPGVPDPEWLTEAGRQGWIVLRVNDADRTWRIVYYVESAAVVILDVFSKKTVATPKTVIESCQQRLAAYQRAASGKE